jgi:hypothetical protein
MSEMPLDDYRFELNSLDQQVRHKFSTLLPEGEELLWMGRMKRGFSYWLSKGFWGLLALLGCLLLTAFLWFMAYIGFYEGEYENEYPRVFIAFAASLVPWVAGYALIFRRLIYDAKTRYGLSNHYLLLYLPYNFSNPYQGYVIADLFNLSYKEHSDDTVSISYALELPDDQSGGIYWATVPLFEFLEGGLTVFNQITSLQYADMEEEE